MYNNNNDDDNDSDNDNGDNNNNDNNNDNDNDDDDEMRDLPTLIPPEQQPIDESESEEDEDAEDDCDDEEEEDDEIQEDDCEDVKDLQEYIGCKVERDYDNGTMTITQPVLLQGLCDKLEVRGEQFETVVATGEGLHPYDEGAQLDHELQKEYQLGVGKLLHLTEWSRPDISNAVRDLSRFMGRANGAHLKAMKRVVKYCVDTPNRGLFMGHNKKWNGKPTFKFDSTGWSDFDCAEDSERVMQRSMQDMESMGRREVLYE